MNTVSNSLRWAMSTSAQPSTLRSIQVLPCFMTCPTLAQCGNAVTATLENTALTGHQHLIGAEHNG
ncbi:hypothetical protein D3C75_1358930 [compost metagenome]